MGDPTSHRLVGGALCLDFINTRNGHRKTVFNEYLNDYGDLAQWARHSQIITTRETDFLIQKERESPEKSTLIFKKAIDFRESLFGIFSSIIFHTPVPKKALNHLTRIHLQGWQNTTLAQKDDRVEWIWKPSLSMDRILWTIAMSAIRILTSDQLKWVRECSGNDCDWLFLDKSRNKKRRWCSMAECGNRFKMRQRYIRQVASKKDSIP